ncbi:MAG: putative ribosome biogenesis GTPase RsgA [Candidatus Anoxychlamydiales bacterium]|nr:putative ribosome biogenesis GTPase RsgA [Candidatus Anoxychlamydiales bacterium]
MKDFDERLNFEEKFHSKNNKEIKKQRKLKQKKDRSKYKKTNLDKKEIKKVDTKDLIIAKVISISKEEILAKNEGITFKCSLRGLLKKEYTFNKNVLAVGDNVFLKKLNEDQGVIELIDKRFSILSRFAPRKSKKQIIAVNIDQVLITSSVVTPPLKPSLIDRYVISANKGNMDSIIIINKIDLLESNEEEKKRYLEFIKEYKKLDYKIVSISCKDKISLDKLKKIMKEKTSVFSGQSGVGKSSIINAIFKTNLKTKDLAKKTYKGAHVTTKAELIELKNKGFCIDTPGIKSFGIWDLKIDDIKNHFTDFLKYSKNCKYKNCKHINENDCSVKKALKEKKISHLRFESYHSLIKEVLEKKGY